MKDFLKVGIPIALSLGLIKLVQQSKIAEEYKDVLLVINDNSPESIEIGNYFAKKRYIKNIIHLNTLNKEVVKETEYHENILNPIKEYLSMRDDINYIVTTKGIPLVVIGDDEIRKWYNGKSMDNMLTILNEYEAEGWSPIISEWTPQTRKTNNYFTPTKHFSNKYFGMYLVTRLTGYTVEGVKNMIDRSVNTKIGKFVFDEDPISMGNYFLPIAELLQINGYDVLYDTTTQYLKNQENVTGYRSWGDNDSSITGSDQEIKEGSVPNNTWTNGSVAELISSTCARTFIKENWNKIQLYRQTMLGDLLENGLTGAQGHGTEPFFDSLSDPYIFYKKYLSGFNMAESFYAATGYINWKTVVIGDPKMRIR